MVNQGDIPSVKDLASSNPSIRRLALGIVLTDLSTRPTLTPTQSLQLWKGFFFALYMHDSKSAISVQNVISQLASLISSTNTSADPQCTSLALTEAFWITICREWSGIDVHRMDKYLLLIRMVLREIFSVVMSAGKEEGGVVERQVELLERFPLSPRDRKVPDGLRYHVLDIYVDEMEKALQSMEAGDVQEAVNELLGPVEVLGKEGLSKCVRDRAKKEVLADERVVVWKSGAVSVTARENRADGNRDGDKEFEGFG